MMEGFDIRVARRACRHYAKKQIFRVCAQAITELEDITQEAVIRLWENSEAGIKPSEQVIGYAVLNAIDSVIGRPSRMSSRGILWRNPMDIDKHDCPDPQPDLERQAIARQALHIAIVMLENAPPADKLVLHSLTHRLTDRVYKAAGTTKHSMRHRKDKLIKRLATMIDK